jgi:hypothetical protein
MITIIIVLLILERIAKFTGIEPRVLIWLKEKLRRKNQPMAKLEVGVEVMEIENKKAA